MKYLKYMLLISILPFALYINFFVINLGVWSYEFKALYVFTSLIYLGEFLSLSLSLFIIYFVFRNNKLVNKKFLIFLINLLMLSNIFFFASIFNKTLYIFIPMMQFIIIFTFSIKKLVTKKKKNKKLFSIEKTNDPMIYNKIFISLSSAIIISFSSFISIYIISKNYDPLVKSLDYYFEGSGVKVKRK